MRVVPNNNPDRRPPLTARARRTVRSAMTFVVNRFVWAWNQAFPMPPIDGPETPPTLAKAAALHEGALLSEEVDAVSKKHIA